MTRTLTQFLITTLAVTFLSCEDQASILFSECEILKQQYDSLSDLCFSQDSQSLSVFVMIDNSLSPSMEHRGYPKPNVEDFDRIILQARKSGGRLAVINLSKHPTRHHPTIEFENNLQPFKDVLPTDSNTSYQRQFQYAEIFKAKIEKEIILLENQMEQQDTLLVKFKRELSKELNRESQNVVIPWCEVLSVANNFHISQSHSEFKHTTILISDLEDAPTCLTSQKIEGKGLLLYGQPKQAFNTSFTDGLMTISELKVY